MRVRRLAHPLLRRWLCLVPGLMALLALHELLLLPLLPLPLRLLHRWARLLPALRLAQERHGSPARRAVSCAGRWACWRRPATSAAAAAAAARVGAGQDAHQFCLRARLLGLRILALLHRGGPGAAKPAQGSGPASLRLGLHLQNGGEVCLQSADAPPLGLLGLAGRASARRRERRRRARGAGTGGAKRAHRLEAAWLALQQGDALAPLLRRPWYRPRLGLRLGLLRVRLRRRLLRLRLLGLGRGRCAE